MSQDVFAKKDNKAKKTLGSSHLICPEPEGQKYQAALKWSLPVVNKDWLLACLRDRAWVSEKPFLVGKCKIFTEDKPLPSKVKVGQSKKETRSCGAMPVDQDVTVELNLDGDVENSHPAPLHTKQERQGISGTDKRPFAEVTKEKYQKMGGQEVSKKARLNLDRSRRSEVAGQGEPSHVLAGVVLLVAKKLGSRSSELHKIVERLGGTISWSLAPSVTHFVFQGKANDLTKEFKQAKQQGCKIVSPDWVYKCRDENKKVSEFNFPHTFNPRMKLNMIHDNTNNNTTTNTTLNTTFSSILNTTNSSLLSNNNAKAAPRPELSRKEKMEEEDLEDTRPVTLPTEVPPEDPVEAEVLTEVLTEVPAEVPAEVPDEVEAEEMKEISLELAGLYSLLGNINKTRVSAEHNIDKRSD